MTNVILTAVSELDSTVGDLSTIMGAFMGAFSVLAVMLLLTYIAAWKIFTKAGYAGWKCLIPFYNQYILCKISFGVDKGWYFVFGFIPLVSYVFPFVLEYKLCQAFGKDFAFTILALLFTPITRLILGFGSSELVNKPRYY